MANDYEAAGESWAAGETGAVEGVTETTPATEAPAPETQAPPAPVAPAPGTEQPTLLESSEAWARDDKGRFAPKVDEPAASAATEADPAARAATQAEISAAIKAQLHGKDIDVPENLMIPLKRNGKVEYVPLKDVMASGMMERDYRFKTEEVARQRQEVQQYQARIAATEAAANETRRQLAEEHASWEAAKRDPVKLAQWENHYKLMASDPQYKQTYEAAQRARVVEAENGALRAQVETREAEDITRQLTSQITAMGAEYPGVEPGRIMQQYGLILKAGEVDTFDMNHVRWLYQQEASNAQAARAPILSQVEALTAELASVKKLQAAVAKNAATDTAISRAKAPNLAPSGTPQSHVPAPPKPYTSADADEVRSAWSKVR